MIFKKLINLLTRKDFLTKYSILYINYKRGLKNKKPVLISYRDKKEVNGKMIYLGTQLIDIDPYFIRDKNNASHYYVFKDEGFYLENNRNHLHSPEFYEKCRKPIPYSYIINKPELAPTEFQVKTEEEATKIFKDKIRGN